MNEIRIDALLPAEMAVRAEYLGVRKAENFTRRTFLLVVLAGLFISFGGIFATNKAEVVKNLKPSDKVLEAIMTFGLYDAVALVQFDSLDELGKLLANVIQPIPGVLETLTCLAADH